MVKKRRKTKRKTTRRKKTASRKRKTTRRKTKRKTTRRRKATSRKRKTRRKSKRKTTRRRKTKATRKPAKRRKRKTKRKGKRKASGLTKMTYSCSASLQNVVGSGKLTRPQVVKKLWTYIKKHKCQDSKNRRLIVPDKKLSKVIGSRPVDMLKLAGHISKHLK